MGTIFNTLIIDASHLAYRVFFALPKLSFDENNTHLIYGFLSNLLSYVKRYPIKMLVIVEDRGHVAKDAIYPQYKARKPGQEPLSDEQLLDFTTQFGKLVNFLDWLGVTRCFSLGAEADDVIAHLVTKRCTPFKDGIVNIVPPILVLSGDHDLHSLLSEDTVLWKPHKDGLYTVAKFKEEFQNLEPSKYKDILSLMGCAGDNVPGVRGIGPKFATSLIRRYGSLDAIRESSDDERLVNLVKDRWSEVELSSRLVSYEDVEPIMIKEEPDLSRVRRNLFALGMESLVVSWPDMVHLSSL